MKNRFLFIVFIIAALFFSCEPLKLRENPWDPGSAKYSIPTADFTANGGLSVAINGLAELDGSASLSPTASALSYRWDFTNDGTFDTAFSLNPKAYYQYPAVGTYECTLEVKNEEGHTDKKTKTVTTYESKAPSALFSHSPTNIAVGSVVSFDASGSSDDDTPQEELEIRWDFENDGSFDVDWATTKTTTHIFESAGTFTVRLEVRDRYDLVGFKTQDISVVSSQPPQANFTWSPSSPWINETITFNASSSTDDDTSASEIKVRWDFENDGTFDVDWTTTKTATHIYTTAGVYTVKLEVKDKYELAGSVSKDIIVTSSQSPQASFTVAPSAGTINTPFAFDASSSTNPGGGSLEYRWDFENDGTWDTGFSTTKKINHQFTAQNTTFTVMLEVRNSTGLTSFTTKNVPIGQFEGFENGMPPVWTTGGDYPWFLCSTAHSGSYSATNGICTSAGQTSWLRKTVTGPIIAKFWLISPYISYVDYSLTFSIDSDMQLYIENENGPLNWTEYIFQIPSGSHTIEWLCIYDGNGGDLFILDDVEFIPTTE
jgi:PKD repeat protein